MSSSKLLSKSILSALLFLFFIGFFITESKGQLQAYSGVWTETQAQHLLSRSTFGPSIDMIDYSVSIGLTATLDELFTIDSLPDPPLKSIPDGTNNNQLDDPAALYGQPWINGDPFPNVNPPMYRNRILRSRSKSLYSWTFLQMHYSGISIREKLSLFWHNHLVAGELVIPHREYLYYNVLRTHALGNFKQLIKDITLDTGMLIFLSGAENTKNSPNENYARELLELFTIGKGAQVALGDYTNYTEDDITEIAKILTGWRVAPVSDTNTLTAQFDSTKHTLGDKTLSYRFNNAIINENGDQEYADLIDVIFQQDETSKFIVRQLYIWFVNPEISPSIESSIIEPLAVQLRNDNYEITPTLKTLLGSQHFFETTRCMIKSPVDLIMSTTRGLGIEPPQSGIEEEYNYAYNFYIMSADLEQALFFHPTVAGWQAYYQEPQYDKYWLNTVLLPKRHQFCELMINGGSFNYNDVNYPVNSLVPVLDIANNIPNATNPDTLITQIANHMFAYPLDSSQIDALKEVLIPGLPDFEWSVEYGTYLSNPSDPIVSASVEAKLRDLFGVLVKMSEFQIH